MEDTKIITEPLRISNSGKYELYDYVSSTEITLSGALLLDPYFENNLNTTIKIIDKKSQVEFDRFMLMAFRDPSRPMDDKIKIKGKFFNPKKYYLKIEPKNGSDDVHFLLYFSVEVV
jgi:hypothetical protein